MSTLEFSHDGLPLTHWLIELVADDPRRRTAAANVLSTFFMNGRDGTFSIAVKKAVSDMPAEPVRYVARVADFLIHAQTERLKEFNIDTDSINKPVEQNDASQLDALQINVWSEFPKVQANDWLTQQVAAAWVFKAMDELALTSPVSVRKLLLERNQYHQVTDALLKAGDAAAPYLEELLLKLAARDSWDHKLYQITASLLCKDALRTARIVGWLDETSPRAITAASLLGGMGRRAAELVPACIGKLMECATREKENPARTASIFALGKVTTGTRTAIDLLLKCSRENDMWVRGAAISALGNVAKDASLVVPRLIECLTDYLDPDPDYAESSDYEMVATALARFGADAAPAVPELIKRIERSEGGIDRAVVIAMGAIGPQSSAALPTLERLLVETALGSDDQFLKTAIAKIKKS